MPRKKFKPEPDDTYTKWSWDGGYMTVNTRYYLLLMPKTERTQLDNMMNALSAKMEVTDQWPTVISQPNS